MICNLSMKNIIRIVELRGKPISKKDGKAMAKSLRGWAKEGSREWELSFIKNLN